MTGNTVKVALKDATRKQLRKFAIETLGLPLANLDKERVIIAKMRQAGYEKDYIEVADAGAEPDPAAPKASATPRQIVTTEERDNEWFEIEIPISDAPGGGEPVYVNVNGIGQRIHRGCTQWVRYPYIHALANAVQTLYRQEQPEEPMEAYEAKAYPFTVMRRGLTHDQVRPLIEAFQAEQAAARR